MFKDICVITKITAETVQTYPNKVINFVLNRATSNKAAFFLGEKELTTGMPTREFNVTRWSTGEFHLPCAASQDPSEECKYKEVLTYKGETRCCTKEQYERYAIGLILSQMSMGTILNDDSKSDDGTWEVNYTFTLDTMMVSINDSYSCESWYARSLRLGTIVYRQTRIVATDQRDPNRKLEVSLDHIYNVDFYGVVMSAQVKFTVSDETKKVASGTLWVENYLRSDDVAYNPEYKEHTICSAISTVENRGFDVHPHEDDTYANKCFPISVQA